MKKEVVKREDEMKGKKRWMSLEFNMHDLNVWMQDEMREWNLGHKFWGRGVCWYSESRLMLSLVNVISRLMWSHYESPFTIAYYKETTGYCYHSVNVITFGLAQSDHIKRLLLYLKLETYFFISTWATR